MIKILPEEVVNRIAAGEVVERPSSVVKELVENSLDAGATRINVEFEQSGKKLIRVSDNGSGMDKENALLSVKRHATSKISSFSDLQSIHTLGFRGEALPSICTVSRFRMVTKTAGAPNAVELAIEGEKVLYARETAGVEGTIIEVKDLFFNLPARLKFLKADATEQSHIIRTIEECALAHSSTGFSAVGNKKVIFNSPPCSEFAERVSDILGANMLSGMLAVNSETPRLKITGLISSIQNSQPNKNVQYFFINSRPVMNRMLSQAVYDAYRDSLPIGRHPAVVLLIEIDPKIIDVNVHPAKRIVKFTDEFEVYGPLNSSISEALSRKKTTPFILQTARKPVEMNLDGHTAGVLHDRQAGQTDFTGYTPARDNTPAPIPAHKIPEYRVIGQMHQTYIIAESSDGVVIFDQHAANERVLYERFLSIAKNPEHVPVQELLIPLNLDLTPHELEIIKPNAALINGLGFEMSEFGKNSIMFRALPAFIGNIKRINDFFREFAGTLIENFSNPSLNLQPLEKIIRAACRAAVKASDRLSFEEMEILIKELMECSQPNCCPHGRPTMVKITTAELEKKFLRK